MEGNTRGYQGLAEKDISIWDPRCAPVIEGSTPGYHSPVKKDILVRHHRRAASMDGSPGGSVGACRVATAWLGCNAQAHTGAQGRNESPEPCNRYFIQKKPT